MNATKIPLLVVAAAGVMFTGGCASNHSAAKDYKTRVDDPRRNSDVAREENAKAADLIDKGDYAGAEPLLRDALTADIGCGPAHNNLGKVYYHDKRLYLAAWEFEYATKLMPNQPEPRNNLGLVFESVGKLDDAVKYYGQAMGLEPDNGQFIGNLARARVRRGDGGEPVRDLLGKLVLRDERPEWVAWARRRLALMPRASESVEK